MTAALALVLAYSVDQCPLHVNVLDLAWRQYKTQFAETDAARKALAACKSDCEQLKVKLDVAEASLGWHAKGVTEYMHEVKKFCVKQGSE